MRETVLTDAMANRIVQMVIEGNYVSTAMAAVGIPRSAYYYWRSRAEAEIEPYASLFRRIDEAEADAEVRLLAEVHRGLAREGNQTWILERRFPSRWGGRVKTAVQDNIDEILLRLKSDPELSAKVQHVLTQETVVPGRE